MYVPEGREEEKKLSILLYNSCLLPTNLPAPPELGIHAFLPDSLEKYDILSVCGSTNSHHVGAAQNLHHFRDDSSPLIPASVSGLDGVITVAYICLLGGQHCKRGRGRERRTG